MRIPPAFPRTGDGERFELGLSPSSIPQQAASTWATRSAPTLPRRHARRAAPSRSSWPTALKHLGLGTHRGKLSDWTATRATFQRCGQIGEERDDPLDFEGSQTEGAATQGRRRDLFQRTHRRRTRRSRRRQLPGDHLRGLDDRDTNPLQPRSRTVLLVRCNDKSFATRLAWSARHRRAYAVLVLLPPRSSPCARARLTFTIVFPSSCARSPCASALAAASMVAASAPARRRSRYIGAAAAAEDRHRDLHVDLRRPSPARVERRPRFVGERRAIAEVVAPAPRPCAARRAKRRNWGDRGRTSRSRFELGEEVDVKNSINRAMAVLRKLSRSLRDRADRLVDELLFFGFAGASLTAGTIDISSVNWSLIMRQPRSRSRTNAVRRHAASTPGLGRFRAGP